MKSSRADRIHARLSVVAQVVGEDRGELSQLSRRVARLERQIDSLLEILARRGIDPAPDMRLTPSENPDVQPGRLLGD